MDVLSVRVPICQAAFLSSRFPAGSIRKKPLSRNYKVQTAPKATSAPENIRMATMPFMPVPMGKGGLTPPFPKPDTRQNL